MAKSKKSVLVTRIAQVIAAALAGENSKERIGNLLRDLLDTAPTEYDELATYEAKQWIIWRGRLVQSLFPIGAGESPEAKPNKWFDPVASTAVQMGENLEDYLVTQKGLVRYVAQQINASGVGGVLPIADETKAGVSKRATLQTVLARVNNTDHVTPVTLGAALDQAVETLLGLLEEQRLFGSDLNTEVSNAAGLAVAVDELNGAGVIGRVIKFMGRLKFIDWLGLGLSDLKTLITDSPLITGGIGYKTVVNVDSIQLFDVRYYNPVAQIWYNATVTWAKFLELVRKAISLDDAVRTNPVTRATAVFGGLGLFARANADFADKILVLTDVVIDGQPAHFAEYKTHRQVLLSAIANADQELLDFISSRLNVGGGGSTTPPGVIIGVRCADTFTQNPSSTFRITPAMIGVAQAHNLNASGDDILPTLLDKNRRPDQVMTLSLPDANHFVVNYADESYSGYEGGILDLRVVGTTAKIYRVVVHTAGVNRWWQTEVGETKPTLGDTSAYPLARRWKEISAELYGAASLTECDGMGEIEPPVAPTPVLITITALAWTYDGRSTSQAFGGYATVKDNKDYEGQLFALDGQEPPIDGYLPMAVISQTIQSKAVNRSFGHGPISEGYHGVRPKRYRYRVQEVGNPDNYLEQVITLDAIVDAPNNTAKSAGYKIEYNGTSNVITFGTGPGGGTPPTVQMIPNDLISPFTDTKAYSMRAFGSILGGRSYDWIENHYVNVPQGSYIVEFGWSDGTLLYDTLTITSATASGAFTLKTSTPPTGLRINDVSARKQSNGLWLSEANTGVVAEMCRIAIYADGTTSLPNRWIEADFYDGFYDGRGASVFHEWPQSAPASYIDVWRPKGSAEPRLVMRYRYAVTGGGGSTDKILDMRVKYVDGAGWVVYGSTTAAVEVYQYIIDASGKTVGGNGWLALNKIGGFYDASGATVERVLPDAKQGRLPGTYTVSLSVRPAGSTNANESILLNNAYSVVVEGSSAPTPTQGETSDWELDTDDLPANTAARIEYRFVKSGGVNGNFDRIEFRMADTYADNPMYIDLQLTSGNYNFGRGFQRSSTVDSETGLQLRIAVYDTGAYAGKSLKVGISQQTGTGATLLFQYSFIAPAATQTGWTRLFPA
jgi:hypothetical protein